MSAVNITSVRVLNNPAPFTAPLSFDIQYECLTPLADDLEWKIIYVGSAESDQHDQVLESVMVGPVAQGAFGFTFEADHPNPALIPPEDIAGVTVVLLTCSYREREFIRIGYYVNNEYDTEELRENNPMPPQLDRLYRNILADHPRVTKFPIEFDNDVAPAVDGATAPQAFGAPSYGQPAAMFDVAPQQSAVVGEPEAMET